MMSRIYYFYLSDRLSGIPVPRRMRPALQAGRPWGETERWVFARCMSDAVGFSHRTVRR